MGGNINLINKEANKQINNYAKRGVSPPMTLTDLEQTRNSLNILKKNE